MNEPTRQVHLDFHTSEYIPDVGKNFSKENFKNALKISNVNQVNIFAKCHHSWYYYPTKLKNAIMHPNLNFDLLGEQIKACHEIGIKAPIYLTVGWSANDAKLHPEWCMRDVNGEIIEWNQKTGKEVEETSTIAINLIRENKFKDKEFRPFCNWKFLCPSGLYKKLILDTVKELCQKYKVDGFFFDIHFTQLKCYCENCKESISKHNFDIDNPSDVNKHWNQIILKTFIEDTNNEIKSYYSDASIFYNGTTSLEIKENLQYRLHENGSKIDLEHMPSSWGGYDKLATQSRYFHNFGNKPIVAMSGKFHTTWGEFGGFKYADALKYEAASMISHGVRCNFGDHLHPSGLMDMCTYENIGYAFEYIEKMEEFGIGGKPHSNVALVLSGNPEADEGISKMLLEEHIEYEVIGQGATLNKIREYQLIIISSGVVLEKSLIQKLKKFINENGKIIFVGEGALNEDKKEFIFDIGAKYVGNSEYDIDYIQVRKELSKNLILSPFISYSPALKTRPHKNTKILADLKTPYFSRTIDKYNGHLYSPNKLHNEDYPSVFYYKNILFFANNIDRIYAEHGARVHRQLFRNALGFLIKNFIVEINGLPSSGRISLLHQKEKKRFILHLFYAPPLKRGGVIVIEDMPKISNLDISLNINWQIKSVKMINLNKKIYFKNKEKVNFKLDYLIMHEIIVLEYI